MIEYMVTFRRHGHRQRFVTHAYTLLQAAENATAVLGEVVTITSICEGTP